MLAKGRVFASREKLSQLLSLPEEVEVIGVSLTEDGIEFLVMSAEPTVATRQATPMSLLRRVTVDTLEELKNKDYVGGFVATGQLAVINPQETVLSNKDIEKLTEIAENVKSKNISNGITITVVKQEEKDVQKLFSDIIGKIKK